MTKEIKMSCPSCGMTFTGESEDEVKRKLMDHGKVHK